MRRFYLLIGFIQFFTLLSTGYSCPDNRVGIQAAMATGGNLGIGIIHFTKKTELGFTLSGNYNNASHQTKHITPVIFGGIRNPLCQCTDFVYGLELVSTWGRDHGCTIHADYGIGPYISLEQLLTYHVMLTGWIQPYQYQYQKIGRLSTTTNHFFSTGGIGINYLF